MDDQPLEDTEKDFTALCVTVREVMAIYRIGRCTAYEQAALFLRHGPGHGIPCMKIGHSLRFPIAWIEAHIGRPVIIAGGTPALDDYTLQVPSSQRDREAPVASAPPPSVSRRGTR